MIQAVLCQLIQDLPSFQHNFSIFCLLKPLIIYIFLKITNIYLSSLLHITATCQNLSLTMVAISTLENLSLHLNFTGRTTMKKYTSFILNPVVVLYTRQWSDEHCPTWPDKRCLVSRIFLVRVHIYTKHCYDHGLGTGHLGQGPGLKDQGTTTRYFGEVTGLPMLSHTYTSLQHGMAASCLLFEGYLMPKDKVS